MQCSSVGCSLAQWKDRYPCRPEFGPDGKLWEVNKKQQSFDGRGAQSPVWHKKTGERSARARTRGQNPLVNNIQSITRKTIKKKFVSVEDKVFVNDLGQRIIFFF